MGNERIRIDRCNIPSWGAVGKRERQKRLAPTNRQRCQALMGLYGSGDPNTELIMARMGELAPSASGTASQHGLSALSGRERVPRVSARVLRSPSSCQRTVSMNI